jgi:transcriptional regulator with XRE-family HTH domain
METLSERLKFARGLADLSCRRLALLAGRTPQWASALERGAYASPSAASIAAIGRVLGVSIEWLLSGAGEAPTEESVRAAIAASPSKEAA